MLMRRGLRAWVVGAMAACALAASSWAADGTAHDWNPCPAALGDASAPDTSTPSPPAHPRWELTLSPWTHHWNYNPAHRHVLLGAMDRYVAGQRFCGLALFSNSFGQPSAYAYVGQRWDGVMGHPDVFVKVSAGLIYGYKDPYKNKIPFNDYGVAPAIIPALGYRFGQGHSVQMMVLGNAGILFAYGHTF